MELFTFLSENMVLIGTSILAFIAGFDKIAMIAITTLANIRDTWRQNFPKKPDYK